MCNADVKLSIDLTQTKNYTFILSGCPCRVFTVSSMYGRAKFLFGRLVQKYFLCGYDNSCLQKRNLNIARPLKAQHNDAVAPTQGVQDHLKLNPYWHQIETSVPRWTILTNFRKWLRGTNKLSEFCFLSKTGGAVLENEQNAWDQTGAVSDHSNVARSVHRH